MAILQKKSFRHGIDGNYWMIASVTKNKINQATSCRLVAYVSKAARTANINDYIEGLNKEYPYIPGYNLSDAEIYTWIKANDDFFATAVDDL